MIWPVTAIGHHCYKRPFNVTRQRIHATQFSTELHTCGMRSAGGSSHKSSQFTSKSNHDDVIKWKKFPRYWPFVRGIHLSPVVSLTQASGAELSIDMPVIWDAIALIMTSLECYEWDWQLFRPKQQDQTNFCRCYDNTGVVLCKRNRSDHIIAGIL